MKRSGANARRRTEPTTADNERPRGPLTDEELAAVRGAYESGCSGTLIIGMRGEERTVTMLLRDAADASEQDRMSEVRAQLRRLGCDSWCRVQGTRGQLAHDRPVLGDNRREAR